jgi:phage tail protein X
MITYVYTTVGGDFWDLIAYKLWGKERYTNLLMEANPLAINVIRFDAGFPLLVPVISATPNSAIQPWNQIYRNS